jgi:hypothetical protein
MQGDVVGLTRLFWKIVVGKSINHEQSLIRTALLSHVSYRLDSSANSDLLVGLKEWYRHALIPKKKPPVCIKKSVSTAHLFIAGNHLNEEKEIAYTERNSSPCQYVISKDGIGINHLTLPVYKRLLLMAFSFFLALRSIFKNKNRSNHALLIREYLEVSYILFWSIKHRVHSTTLFHPYEVDSNLLSYVLRNHGIKVRMVPSGGPLFLHNSILLADEVVFSTPYHLDEYQHQFQQSILAQQFSHWPLESLDLTVEFNEQFNNTITRPLSIGFYSHGSWLRQAMKHQSDGLLLQQEEEELLIWLKQICHELQVPLLIFLHPKERAASHLVNTKKHYKSILGPVDFQLANLLAPSSQTFSKALWGVGCYSSILFERLALGHLTLIKYNRPQSFPNPAYSLSNISFQAEGQLRTLLTQHPGSYKAFFIANHLENYLLSDDKRRSTA